MLDKILSAAYKQGPYRVHDSYVHISTPNYTKLIQDNRIYTIDDKFNMILTLHTTYGSVMVVPHVNLSDDDMIWSKDGEIDQYLHYKEFHNKLLEVIE